jgi:methyltransferase (TIGR00027 family)
MQGEPSRTAMVTAIGRGLHRLTAPRPWILDDAFALLLVGPEWPSLIELLESVFPSPVLREATAGVVVRSRYVEDRLDSGVFRQYVILGAGLDSFAWRRPDLLRSIRVFEVDHPATQAWKQERASALALPRDAAHVYVPVDFEADTISSGLHASGFDWNEPTLFSWMGVTMYLTMNGVETTLRTVAECAPGSEISFTYVPPEHLLDDVGREFLHTMAALAAQAGEPVETLLTPADAESLTSRCQLTVSDHPTRDELVDRYFSKRGDGLMPYTTERLISARAPTATEW